MPEKTKITYVIKQGRVEVHEGLLDGSRPSVYYHPECEINCIGAMKGTYVRREMINNAIMSKLQEMHMSIGSLRDMGARARR